MTNSFPVRQRAIVFSAAGRLVLWIYGYFAFEWLFFATMSSIVSSSSWGVRILMLLVPPLIPAVILVPVQALLAAADAFGRPGRRRWIAAILPSLVALLFALIAVRNFARTLFGRGIVDIGDETRWRFLVAAFIVWVFLLWREAGRLAAPAARGPLVTAAALIGLSIVSLPFVLIGRQPPAPPTARRLASRPAYNVLLVGIDGISATRMSLYGATRKTTVNIERMASHAVVFENAFSNVGITCGSLISLLTGKRATETHVYQAPVHLDGALAVEHLPGILRSAGYSTAQIGLRMYGDAGDWNMTGAFDLVNGRRLTSTLRQARSSTWDRVDRFGHEVVDHAYERVLHLLGIRPMEDTYRLVTGEAVSEAFADRTRMRLAEDFIASRREPWFLHMHLLDTHCCDWGYAPYVFAKHTAFRDAKWRADRGDDGLLQVDRYAGSLIEFLRSTGQLDRTIVIIYSDHSLGWTTVERVPLIIAVPHKAAARVRANVELIDVAPTILDELGIARPAWMKGRPLLRGESLARDHAIFGLWIGDEFGKEKLPQPPFNGARSASIVICDRWLEMMLADGSVSRRGIVEGHTAPCSDPTFDQRAPGILASHLRANGYPVSDAGDAVVQRASP